MTRFQNGWVKLNRNILESDIFKNDICFRLWCFLLMSANWKTTKIIWEGNQKELLPGMLCLGEQEVALKIGCSKSSVNKWLRYLEKTERIAIEARPRGTVVTICNWLQYQVEEFENKPNYNHNAITTQSQRNHNATLIEEGKKERRKEIPPYPQKNLGDIQAALSDCVTEWGKTLAHFGIKKDPRLDEMNLLRLLNAHGSESTKLAIIGARYEQKTETFDPSKHVSIRRLMKPDNFDKFSNLGSLNQEKQTAKNATRASIEKLRAEYNERLGIGK